MARYFPPQGPPWPPIRTQSDQPPASAAHRVFLGFCPLLSVLCFGVWFLLRLEVFQAFGSWRAMGLKLLLAGGCAFFILFLARYVEGLVGRHAHSKGVRYNLVRLIRLVTALLVILVFVSFLFQNWYAAVV